MTRTDHQGTTIYVLAASHFGLPVEYDEYLDTVVIPAFGRANVLHFEGAGGREKEPRPVCDPAVLDTQGRKTLEAARQQTLTLTIATKQELGRRERLAGIDDPLTAEQWAKVLRAEVAAMDEFDLMEDYNLNATVSASFANENASALPVKPITVLRDDMAHFLAKRNPTMQIRDLDTRYGVRRSYCNSGKNRIKMLQSTFSMDRGDSDNIQQRIPVWNKEFVDVVRGRPLPDGSSLSGLRGMDEQILCERTKAWVRELAALDDKQVHFIVAGARHIHDNFNMNAPCDGILTGLRKANFDVRSVKRIEG